MFVVIVVLLLSPILYSYLRHLLSLKNYPHGPFPLPIVGNVHQLGKYPHKILSKMAIKYGDVFSISFGMKRVVIVNTIEHAREALITKNNQFAGRMTDSFANNIVSRGFVDVVLSDYNQEWVYLRKLTHSAVKIYGNRNLLDIIMNESKELHIRLRKSEGTPVDTKSELGLGVLNVMAKIVFGETYEIEGSDFAEITKMNDKFISYFGAGDPFSCFSWSRFILYKHLSCLKDFVRIRDKFFRGKVTEHARNYNKDNIRDFTDALIQKLKEESNHKRMSYEKIELIASNLLISGYETTAATLRWMILYLLKWPKYQEYIYNETVTIVGKERYPELSDRKHLHFVEAFIFESIRFSSLTPMGIPRKTIHDTSINGKNIPKDTGVLINFWNIHHDQRYWTKSFEFNPHRWLDDNGNFSKNLHNSFLPFSAGKRSCLGETIAKAELFIFITRLIKDFHILRNAEELLPNFQPEFSLFASPLPFTVIMKTRQ